MGGRRSGPMMGRDVSIRRFPLPAVLPLGHPGPDQMNRDAGDVRLHRSPEHGPGWATGLAQRGAAAGVLTTVSSDNVMLFPQDLPVEPELPPNASQHEDTKIRQEEEGEVQHPKDEVRCGGAVRLPRPSSRADSLLPVNKATHLPERNRFARNLPRILPGVSPCSTFQPVQRVLVPEGHVHGEGGGGCCWGAGLSGSGWNSMATAAAPDTTPRCSNWDVTESPQDTRLVCTAIRWS